MLLNYVVIAGYMLVISGIGLAFVKLNRSGDDFFRSGGRATWWLVGISLFMSGISARTFTANVGAAYEAGFAVLVIYGAGALATLLHFLFFAARFRQTRAVTFPELIRARFGPVAEQIYSYAKVPLFLLTSAIWLWSLAIFVAGAFSLPVEGVILGVGIVVTFASAAGGNWAVMATDVVQGLMLIAMALLLAALCLYEVGGVGELLNGLELAGLTQDLFIKPAGAYPGDNYSLHWAAASVVFTVVVLCGIEGAGPYFSVKDGKSARKAALLNAVLMVLLATVFIVPGLVARVLFADEVNAVNVGKPAESAYAIASLKLLPAGMLGLMATAMFSATMSSMDTGLNRNSAIVVRNMLPALAHRLGKPAPTERTQLILGRSATVSFGILSIIIAWLYTQAGPIGVFELSLEIGAVLMLPLAIPLLLGIIIRQTPSWSALVSAGAALVPGVWSYVHVWTGGDPWPYHWKVFGVLCAGVAAFLLCMPAWRFSSAAERAQINEFFERMRTPVDFEREVGHANDGEQLRLVGISAMILATGILPLCFVGGGARQVLCVLWISGFVGLIGLVLWLLARRKMSVKRVEFQ